MDGHRDGDKITINMDIEKAEYIKELLGQFTYYTTMTILRDGDYPDALDGMDSETGFEPGGFDKPYDAVVDDLVKLLVNLTETGEHD